MSIAVPIPELFAEVDRWGWCYLVSVSDDGRPHLVALHPTVAGDGDDRRLRFEAGTGRAGRNPQARPEVTLVFPPAAHSDGFSLVVDGEATVDGGVVDVLPTWAVLHRPAP
ncbi:MAG: pyridoxamine 5'-phosphate oxidase family protein [Ilumatobacteraceae bacterium]